MNKFFQYLNHKRLVGTSLAMLLLGFFALFFTHHTRAAAPNALRFDGTNRYIQVTDSDSLNVPTNLTFEGWIKPTAVSGHRHVFGNHQYEFAIEPLNTGYLVKFEVFINNTWYRLSSGEYPLNQWRHIAATYDGTTIRLFVHGTLVASEVVTGTISPVNHPLRIGSVNTLDDHMTGIVDEVRLSSSIRYSGNFTPTTTPFTSDASTRGLWHMDEGTGTSTADSSTNGNNGSFVGSPFWTTDSPFLSSTPTPTSAPSITPTPTVTVTPTTTPTSGQLLLNPGFESGNTSWTASTGVITNSTTYAPYAGSWYARLGGKGVSNTTTLTQQITIPSNATAATLQFYMRVASAETTTTTSYDKLYVQLLNSSGGYLTQFVTYSNLSKSASYSLKQFNLLPYKGQTIRVHFMAVEDASLQTSFLIDNTAVNITSTSSTTPTPTTPVTPTPTSSITSTPTPTVNPADPRANTGDWATAMNWPIVAVHMISLPNGNILMWDGWEHPTAYAKVYNPTTQTFSNVTVNSGVFCAGHALLPDGRVGVMGGHASYGTDGITAVNIFNSTNNTWTSAPKMTYPRWYPSVTTLPDGRLITLSGKKDNVPNWADIPEIYDPVANTTTPLTGVNMSNFHEDDYPYPFVLPDGKLFVIASKAMRGHLLDVSAKTWTVQGSIPIKNGTAVMYRPGKILYTGGGTVFSASEKRALVIDLNQPGATWREIAPMKYGRYMHNFILLPDGKVLTVGGGGTVTKTTTTGVLPAEVFDPVTETWTALDSMRDARMYHSSVLLMPDGRVLAAGGGRRDGTTNFLTAEFYSPYYMFKGARPTITSAPLTTGYNTTLQIQTPNAQDISGVSFIRLGSNTHNIDQDQRYVELSFTKGTGTLDIMTPANRNLAPPGYYMLFIRNSQGIPSVAKTIKIN